MSESNDLHKLITSLTKSEKRFFKLYCSIEGGSKNYLLLFDEIGKQKEYDEDKLKKKFREKSFVRHLPVLKNELYNKIVSVLTHFHSGKSIESRIRRLVQETDVLLKKKLYGQAQRKLVKAKKLCERHEKLYLFPDILAMERIVYNSQRMVFDDEQLKKKHEYTRSIMEKTQNLFEYRGWYDYLLMNILYSSRPDQELVSEVFSKILASPLFSSEDQALSITAKWLYHYIHSSHHYYLKEWEDCYYHSCKLMALYRNNPDMVIAHPNNYPSTLALHMNICTNTHRLDEAVMCLNELIKINPGKGTITSAYIYTYSLALYSFHCPSKLEKILNELEEEIEEILSRMDKFMSIDLLYFKAYAHFMTGNYRMALRTIAVIKGISPMYKENVQLYMRILELMIHHEKANDDMLEPLLNSIYRFIKRRGTFTLAEKEILGFFESAMKGKAAPLNELYITLEDILLSDRESRRIIEYLDILAWVRSKRDRKPLSEVINCTIEEVTAG